jgi:hypothetical protein
LARLNLPEQHRAALVKVRALPEAVVRQLTTALGTVPPSAKKAEAVRAVSPHVPDIEACDLEGILGLLYSLYQAKAYLERPLPDFISELCSAMDAEGIPELRLGSDRAVFQDRMRALLSVEPLEVLAKAYALQREHEKIFCDARIFTDLRPVFGARTDDPAIGAFVAHTLKIVYHVAGGHRELYCALDAEDLAKLKAVVERAISKANSLARLLETKDIQNLVS